MTIVGRLRLHVQDRPDDVAFRFLGDGERETSTLTYAELDRQARRVAARLAKHTAPGGRVLLLLPHGPGFIAAFFGCLYACTAAVPVLVPHPRKPLSAFLAIAQNARPAAIVSTASIREYLAPDVCEFLDTPWVCLEEIDDRVNIAPVTRPGADDLALLQYTSGSTGSPKGVMVSHANLIHNEEAICRAFGFSRDSVVGGWLPMFHDMGLIGLVLAPVYYGVPCILMPPAAFVQKPVRWLRMISRYGVTFSGGPNFAYDVCVERIDEAQRTDLDLRSWRVAFNGAEPVRSSTIERFCRVFEPYGFRRGSMYPCYGMAEATLFIAGGEPQREPAVRHVDRAALQAGRVEPVAADAAGALCLVGCGRAWNGTRAEIVNPETGMPETPGRVGEIWVAGDSVTLGYFDRPDETSATFRARLADGGKTLFLRTGDLGFVEDGVLYVTGRMKDIIIVRGRNHYPQDIEACAAGASMHVQPGAAAAFGIELEHEERVVLVQEVKRSGLKAYHRGIALDVQEAVATEQGLGLYQVLLVRPGAVPKTSSGKVRRTMCREMYLRDEWEVLYRHTGTSSRCAGQMKVPA